MRVNMSEGIRRRLFRRAVATIGAPAVRAMVMATPHKALFGHPGNHAAFAWRPIGPVPDTDPPIAEQGLAIMLSLLRANFAVILIADDRQSRDRAVALLKAALDDELPSVLS